MVRPLARTYREGRMLIGYARVSSQDQNLDLQRDALRLAYSACPAGDMDEGIARLAALL